MLVNYGGVTTQNLLGNPSTLTDPKAQTQTKKDKEPDFLKGAADAVSTDALLNAWETADKDKNGVTSREEMASAAYSLLTKDGASAEEKGIGRILATLAIGGKEGTGLSELYSDKDGGVSKEEIKDLAKRDCLDGQVSQDDLKSALGTRYVKDGQDLSLDRLKEVGKVSNNCDPPPGNGNDQDFQNTILDFLKQMVTLLQTLIDKISGGIEPSKTQQAPTTASTPQKAALPALTATGGLSNPFTSSLGLGGIGPLSSGFATPFSTGLLTGAPAGTLNTNLTQSLLSMSSGMLQLTSQSLGL